MYQGATRKREVNPKEKAGVFSIITFIFTFPIFRKGIKKEFEEDDVYEILKDYKSCKLGDELQEEWEKEEVKPKPSFTSVLWRRYGTVCIICGVAKFFVRTIIMVVKPLATGRLVAYFSPGSTQTINDAYSYAGILTSMLALNALFTHTYMLLLLQVAHKMRIAICSLMYRKSLKLTTSSLAEVTNGKIVTLMTKDVLLFEAMMQFGNDVWIGAIQLIIMTYIMYRQIQIAAVVGVAFLIIISPVQFILAKFTMKAKLQTLTWADERIRLIQEILSTIQIIKIYTWEKFFRGLVDKIRSSEVAKLKITYYLKISGICIGSMSTKISFYICLMTYIYLHDNITAEKAFVVLSCYTSVQHIINVTVPLGISQFAEAKTSVKRIKKLLLAKETSPMREDIDNNKPQVTSIGVQAEILRDTPILHDINLDFEAGVHAVTGPVGCGKSSLLKMILEDLTITEGKLKVKGAISYASQDPWLFPGTIRQNILFGQTYEVARYNEVVKVCGLVRDLEKMKRGDRTLVSDRGLNLSKGQQARVNLARAIYKKADIYLLDNPLSALDANVSKHVFQTCFKGFLKNKLVVSVMHQMQFLKEVDTILVMNDGRITNQGKFNDLEAKGISFGTDFVEDSAGDEKDEIREVEVPEADATETTKLINQSVMSISNDPTKMYYENKREGKVLFSVYKKLFGFAGGWKTIPLFILLCIVVQTFSSGFELFLSYWITIEEKLLVMKNNETLANSTMYAALLEKKAMIPVYYSVILTTATVLNYFAGVFMFIMAGMANTRLHNQAIWKILRAPMAFFDQNLSGNILNRFSKDVSIIDEQIPFLFYQCIRIGFILLGVISIMTIIKLEFFFVSLGFAVALYGVRCLYLPTSRSLKRLDGVTRAPVIGHLNASLEGLITIRASGAQSILTGQFDTHQDLHSSTAYMYMSTNRAFGYFLDLLCACYSVIIMFSLIIFTGANAGKVGLALNLSFGLSQILQYGIRQWAELENQMTSVERVVEYTDIEEEYEGGDKPDYWPKQGKISYKNVHLVYPKTRELVLKGITFDVKSGEKIGIIGRTGAGKTSIMSALFRLYGIEDGSITIDGLEIKSIGLEYVRSKISIIPQNPVIFSGTVRSNLDPYDEYSDADIWKSLEEVKLKDIESLDYKVNDGGTNFSAGQKQLICLARAILRNNKIIVLDEATANIDPQTDVLVQETISKKFSDCTIMTIAHRLNTVMGADKVMVVSSGTISEYDSPEVLLKNPESSFYHLVSQAGLLKS